MEKVRNFITYEIHPPEQDVTNSMQQRDDKVLVDFLLVLYEWNEEANKENAKI